MVQALVRIFIVGLLACSCQTTSSRTPNVVLIFADDLGYGDLACYGHPDIETPHLDRMAAEGARFTSFYVAASVCTPSRAALLTGRYPIRNLSGNLDPNSTNGLPLDEVTIADVLQDTGYRTQAVGKWHLGHATPELMPTGRGFEGYVGLLYSNDMMLPWCPWLSEEDILELYRDEEPARVIDYEQEELTELYTEEAVQFIERSSGEPFFLYLAHSMPHLPISASERFAGRSKAGLYGDVIECIDWSVGEILRALRENGLDDDTLVIFTSDNGPWHDLPARMVQRGVERWHTGSSGPLRGAKGTTWEGGFRVPAIVRWPRGVPAGQTIRSVATTMDLFATIAAAAEAPLPEDVLIDGTDLGPLLRGEAAGERGPFFYYDGKHLDGVRAGRWKLRLASDGAPQLFDLESDVSERYDRAASNGELVESLYGQMLSFSQENGGRVSALRNESQPASRD